MKGLIGLVVLCLFLGFVSLPLINSTSAVSAPVLVDDDPPVGNCYFCFTDAEVYDCPCVITGGQVTIIAGNGDCGTKPCEFYVFVDLGSTNHICAGIQVEFYQPEPYAQCQGPVTGGLFYTLNMNNVTPGQRVYRLPQALDVECGKQMYVKIKVDGCLFWEGYLGCDYC